MLNHNRVISDEWIHFVGTDRHSKQDKQIN